MVAPYFITLRWSCTGIYNFLRHIEHFAKLQTLNNSNIVFFGDELDELGEPSQCWDLGRGRAGLRGGGRGGSWDGREAKVGRDRGGEERKGKEGKKRKKKEENEKEPNILLGWDVPSPNWHGT